MNNSGDEEIEISDFEIALRPCLRENFKSK